MAELTIIEQSSQSPAFDGTTNYVKILPENRFLIGVGFQNQQATGKIWLYKGSGQPSSDFGAIRLDPGAYFDFDIEPGQQEIWARSDTIGAILTIVTKIRRGPSLPEQMVLLLQNLTG